MGHDNHEDSYGGHMQLLDTHAQAILQAYPVEFPFQIASMMLTFPQIEHSGQESCYRTWDSTSTTYTNETDIKLICFSVSM